MRKKPTREDLMTLFASALIEKTEDEMQAPFLKTRATNNKRVRIRNSLFSPLVVCKRRSRNKIRIKKIEHFFQTPNYTQHKLCLPTNIDFNPLNPTYPTYAFLTMTCNLCGMN